MKLVLAYPHEYIDQRPDAHPDLVTVHWAEGAAAGSRDASQTE